MNSSLTTIGTLTQDKKMTNQSYVSNELTHFLGRSLPNDQLRYALLREVIRTGWLKASHRDQLGPGFVGIVRDRRRPRATKPSSARPSAFAIFR
jgi:hypothetical protein